MQNYIPNRTKDPQSAGRSASVDRLGKAVLAVLAGTVVTLAAMTEIGVALPAWTLAIVLAPATAALVTTLVFSVQSRTECHPARDREGSLAGEGSNMAEGRASLRAATESPGPGRPMVGSGDRR